jgi:mannosyl-oligosaccharide alpha-1,2-mannosidase
LNPQPKSAEAFPGLVGTEVDIVTGQFQPGTASWGGSSDSFYEYLLKTYAYDNQAFLKYGERWTLAADSTMKYLASSPEGRPDITFLGQYDGRTGVFIPESGHMECFAGGNFLLGGLILNKTEYMDFGLVRKPFLYKQPLINLETCRRLPSCVHLHHDRNRTREIQMDSV